MEKFNIPLVAKGLIAYAVERQVGTERMRLEGSPPPAERRRFCADAVIRGMAELEGLPPDLTFLEQYDSALGQAKHGFAVEPASPQLQTEVGQNFMRYVSALENAGGDSRRRIAEVRELAEDIATHRPWASCKIKLFEPVICTASNILKRMTAERPIRFTYFTLSGGFDPPNHIGDFASGILSDAEAVKATELYQKVAQWCPDARSWRAVCSVYVGGNADPAGTVTDADDFDMSIIREESLLDVGKFLRRYLLEGQGAAVSAFQAAFAGLEPVTAEQYSQMIEFRLENPNKVTDVHELDFDKHTASTVAVGMDWRTYSMKDISAAVYFAFRKSGLGPFQHEARFENKLIGKERPSAGHLSAKEISLAEEICEMDGQRLNFYLETSFDVDAVFGTHVCTAENDDTLNVYADYDMATGQVCDELEVDLHRADGREESVEYRLNAVEKAVLLRKMDGYCQQQTGQTLKEYSAQLMAEDLKQPAGPSM